MLELVGADYVIIGHSERRRLLGETDATVNRKLPAALARDLVPIVYVGETFEEREAGQTLAVLDRQVATGFEGVASAPMSGLVAAYEPVWAIGTGRNARASHRSTSGFRGAGVNLLAPRGGVSSVWCRVF